MCKAISIDRMVNCCVAQAISCFIVMNLAFQGTVLIAMSGLSWFRKSKLRNENVANPAYPLSCSCILFDGTISDLLHLLVSNTVFKRWNRLKTDSAGNILATS